MSNRTKLIVDFESQGVVVRKSIIHWVIFTVSALIITGIIQFCSRPFEGIQANFIGTLKVFAPVLLTLLCLGPVFVYDFLKLSNRIFGPMPRIRDKIHDLSEGEHVTEMRAREDDVHRSLIEDVNILINLVNETRGGTSGESAKSEEKSGRDEAKIEEPAANSKTNDAELLEEVNMLRAVVRKLTEAPSRGKTEEPASSEADE